MAQVTSSNPDCIFCKIAAGRIPCHALFEDDQVLAFLDVGPLSEGHTLIIPRGHWVTLDQVPDEVAAKIGQLLPGLSRAVCQATGAKAWNVLQNNGREAHQAVDHVHFHIIPRREHAGLGISWPAGKLDPQKGAALAAKIKAALE